MLKSLYPVWRCTLKCLGGLSAHPLNCLNYFEEHFKFVICYYLNTEIFNESFGKEVFLSSVSIKMSRNDFFEDITVLANFLGT